MMDHQDYDSPPQSSSPTWLGTLVNNVVGLMHPPVLLAPIGCHYCETEEGLEVSIFSSKTEVVGGSLDGELIASPFSIDLIGLLLLMPDLDRMTWQSGSFSDDDELGAHLSIEGTFHGERLWLRILAEAPDRFPPGRRAIVTDQSFVEIW